MDEFDNIEEPPPIYRSVTSGETPRKSRKFSGWAGRPSAPAGGRDFGAIIRTRSRKGLLLALLALAVVGVQGWLLHDLRNQLGDVSTRLEEAHSSLSLVWESTKRLDEDRMARLGLLADSIRSVLQYAQGEVRLWEASYATLGQRIESNDNAIGKMANALRSASARADGFARMDNSQRTRLEALERQSLTNSSAVEALVRRTISQENNSHDVSSMVASLREALRRLDNDIGAVEQRLASSTSAYGQLGRRVDNLAGFADGFRRVGLSGNAVDDRLSGLGDELRRLRMRVDSMRYVRTVSNDDRSDDNRRSSGSYRGNDPRRE